jgi:serine/threonine protein kinase/predicted Zn-dependent protease
MSPKLLNGDADLDRIVDAFEEARIASPDVDLERFVPDAEHPHYGRIVAELVRLDLESGWERGRPKGLDSYLSRFGEALSDPLRLGELAFEEYRLRRQAGDAATPQDYRRRYGVDTSSWPQTTPSCDARMTGGGIDTPGTIRERIPEAGERLLDFELVAELGRGSFGRVFLARQVGLSDRLVALKISSQPSSEPERLAELQHANIVPVYSCHRHGSLQAICMPFLGRCTLADVLRDLRRTEGLPSSGREFISTVAEAGSTHADLAEPKPQGDARSRGEIQPSRADASLQSQLAPSIRRLFEKASYVDVVAWIGAQLAAGLHHAHERGVLHRDVKPANVLLASDGRPMLLDFNLATRTASVAASASVGGTLPYMAPEQLEAMEVGGVGDARSDVYSLGVVLFELFTGKLPYGVPAGDVRAATAGQLAQRRRGAPEVRRLNAKVPASLGSVVARCLAYEAEDRYQSADELRRDLQRHLDDLPLEFAADRSPVERLAKWARRHPRLSSSASVATAALILLGALGAAMAVRTSRLAKLESQTALHEVEDSASQTRSLLSMPAMDAEQLQEGLQLAEYELDRFGALATADWKEKPLYARLTPGERNRANGQLADLLTLACAGYRRVAESTSDPQRRSEAVGKADACEARLAALEKLFVSPEAASGRERTELSPSDPLTATPERLAALQLMLAGKYGEAIPALQQWRDQTPGDLSAWIVLANAYAGIGNHAEAESLLTTAARMRPAEPLSRFLRGVARQAQQKHVGAVEDFTAVLQREPRHLAAQVNRAISLHALHRDREALADLEQAIDSQHAPARVYFVRSAVRRSLGDEAGAKADFATGLLTVPGDANSWIARGVARLSRDPEGALEDFRKADAVDPGNRLAAQNIVHVLADRLGRTDEAVAALDDIVNHNALDAEALISRAVARARLKDVDGAEADVQAALAADRSATTYLRAACVDSLLAGDADGDDAREKYLKRSLCYLAKTFSADSRLVERAESDPDLAAVRRTEQFETLTKSARILSQAAMNREVPDATTVAGALSEETSPPVPSSDERSPPATDN